MTWNGWFLRLVCLVVGHRVRVPDLTGMPSHLATGEPVTHYRVGCVRCQRWITREISR